MYMEEIEPLILGTMLKILGPIFFSGCGYDVTLCQLVCVISSVPLTMPH